MKHKSKTIDGIRYNTKTATLIHDYKHETGTASSSYHRMAYKDKKTGRCFIRIIDFMSDRIQPSTDESILNFMNKHNSLF